MEEESRIRRTRRDRNLAGTTVARLLNITPQYYYEIERGEKRLSADMATRLSTIFNVTTDYLLGQTDLPKGYGERPSIIAETYAGRYQGKRTEDDKAFAELANLLERITDGNHKNRFRLGIVDQAEDQLDHVRKRYNIYFENTPGDILRICEGAPATFVNEFFQIFKDINVNKLLEANRQRVFDALARGNDLPEETWGSIVDALDALVDYQLNRKKKTDE